MHTQYERFPFNQGFLRDSQHTVHMYMYSILYLLTCRCEIKFKIIQWNGLKSVQCNRHASGNGIMKRQIPIKIQNSSFKMTIFCIITDSTEWTRSEGIRTRRNREKEREKTKRMNKKNIYTEFHSDELF